MLPTDEIKTSVSTVFIGADRIVHSRYFPGALVTIAEANEEHAAIGGLLEDVLGERRGPLLVDIRQLKSITPEARKFFASEDSCALAVALLIKSPVTRMFGNFFLRWNRPKHPVRLFTDEARAASWLSEQRQGPPAVTTVTGPPGPLG